MAALPKPKVLRAYHVCFFILQRRIKFGKKIFKMSSRRNFLSGIALSIPFLASLKSNTIFGQKKGMFIHHVYFWLKNAGSKEDKTKLVEGLKKLSKLKTIKEYYIGQPAATRREVIDSSYDVSWLLFFDNAADQDSYQTDPIHLKFVEECSSLWTKVVVYDSIDTNT